jgi:hypothetical protein
MMKQRTGRIITDGLAAGFLGYLIVVIILTAADLIQDRPPFRTAAVLGSVLFFGARETPDIVMGPAPILAYNGVHLLAFLVLGLFLAGLATLSESGADTWYLAIGFFLIVTPHVIGFPIWFVPAVRETFSVWVVVAMTTAAAAAMVAYLWHAHPRLRQQILTNQA